MTTRKSKAKLPALKELVEGDRDMMKALMKEALQEVLEGEMTDHLGAGSSEHALGLGNVGHRRGSFLVQQPLPTSIPPSLSGSFRMR